MGGFNETYMLIVDAFGSTDAIGISSWILTEIFVLSGILKLRNPRAAAIAMGNFGVVQRDRPRNGLMLGVGELLLAALFMVGAFVNSAILPVFSALAALLLGIFTYLIAQSLRAGKRFSCSCFGESDSSISSWTLTRTATLTLIAVWTTVAATWTEMPVTHTAALLQAISAAAIIAVIALVRSTSTSMYGNSDLLGHGKRESA